MSAALAHKKVNASALVKSGKFSRQGKIKLPDEIVDCSTGCSDLVRNAFKARSQHATCKAASEHLGVSKKTLDRILNQETKSPDLSAMLACLWAYQIQHGRGFPLGGGFEIRITQAAQ